MIPVVLLAGGLGTRLSEETDSRPKPMVEVGGRPLLWHVMKHYVSHGFADFFIALGYKGEVVKRYFLEYRQLATDLTVHVGTGAVSVHDQSPDHFRVTLIDTGADTMTGGRVLRLRKHLSQGTFLLTYGDGVSDVDIAKLLAFHRSHGRIATVTAVRPPARFGGLVFDGDRVVEFTEKPQVGEGWINGGFMAFEPKLFDYLENDASILEAHALEAIARDGQLMAYKHDNFWQCVDTLRDLRTLQRLWDSGEAPWRSWSPST
jgi:glucose-1-phosphate cytidylyltransferase